MFNVVNNITITQTPKDAYPLRNRVLKLDFLSSFSWESRWQDMTDKGRIVVPKNLYYKDESNALNPLNGSRVNIGGFGSEPLLMRGDKVQLEAGYMYDKPSIARTVQDTTVILNGYISKVHSKIPLEFEVEDAMFLLKQIAMSTKTLTASDTLENILKLIIDKTNKEFGTSLTYNALSETNFGTLIIGNETAAQLLNRLKQLYGFNSYFRGDELRCGILNYYPSDSQTQTFIMNGKDGNVPAEGQDLEFQRKDDVILSAVAYNTVTDKTGETCKDGSPKTKRTRLEVLVTIINNEIDSKVISKGDRVLDNNEGERRTFFFPDAKTTDALITRATDKLKLYHYDGLKGSFQSFGIPYVRHGDNVDLRNPKQPEQNGTYKIKGVIYEGLEGGGLRQTIELDYKIL